MESRISFRPYRREFLRPLQTAHGTWAVREGFIVRIEENGQIRYTEVAPIPDFGTETVSETAAFLEAKVENPDLSVPANCPACAFALSAQSNGAALQGDLNVAGLLPAGKAALDAAEAKVADGFRFFKWKIGVLPFEDESRILADLLALLPSDSKVRLDANGGLSFGTDLLWLDFVSNFEELIEFIEQPLPVGEEIRMVEISKDCAVPLALDESLNGPNGFRWLESGAWDGLFVIKAMLMGDSNNLLRVAQSIADRLVLSSVFETPFGLQNTFEWAQFLPTSPFAIGYDTSGAFRDDFSVIETRPRLNLSKLSQIDWEELWDRLR